MKNVLYTPEAEDDLAGIKEYITDHLENPIAAVNTVTSITKRIRRLEQFPDMGARVSSVVNIVTDYRFLVCGSYLAFYRTDGNDVKIIRVLYGRSDYVRILFGESTPDETVIIETDG